MRIRDLMARVVLGAAIVASSGCNGSDRDASASGGPMAWFGGAPRVTVPEGTALDVELTQTLSSETAKAGDAWHGVVTGSIVFEGREVIPAGSQVEGVVVAAEEARRGSRAKLQLGVRAIHIEDKKTTLQASSEPVIAGSPRARNLGAIAGGAAAGALLGKAIGGDGDDAAKGAILGGAAATGAVAASKGYQVVLGDGTVMTFTLDKDVSVKVSARG